MTALPLIPHSRPTLGHDESLAVASVVQTGHPAQGPRVEAFERGVASFMGVKGGVAVSSGTVALELALLALGIGPGDEVILPSYVCAAPWLAIRRVGAEPRLVDIEPGTYDIAPQAVARVLSSRTRAVIVPHLFGLPADLTKLQGFGIPLIEDCAQTLGATEQGRRVGSVGALAVCSFYATKLLCAGEGGMVLSNDPVLLERSRALRAYDEEPTLDVHAYNRKMTDLQASLGSAQLGRLRAFLDRRAVIAAAYRKGLGAASLELPAVPPDRTHVYYRFVVRVRGAGGATDALLKRLEEGGVQCRRPVFRPLHRYLGLAGFPESDEAYDRALSLPIYPSLTDAEATRVIEVLREVAA